MAKQRDGGGGGGGLFGGNDSDYYCVLFALERPCVTAYSLEQGIILVPEMFSEDIIR